MTCPGFAEAIFLQLKVSRRFASLISMFIPVPLPAEAMFLRLRLSRLLALTINEPPADAIFLKLKLSIIIMNFWVNYSAVTCPSRIGLVSEAEQMPRWLASWGEGVVTMRITFSDSSISTMYEKLGLLISGYLTRCVNCFRLSVVKSCESCVSLSSYSPFTIGGDYVLIFAQLFTPPFRAVFKV